MVQNEHAGVAAVLRFLSPTGEFQNTPQARRESNIRWISSMVRRHQEERNTLRLVSGRPLVSRMKHLTFIDLRIWYADQSLLFDILEAASSMTVQAAAAAYKKIPAGKVAMLACDPESGIVLGRRDVLETNLATMMDLPPAERAVEFDGVWKVLRNGWVLLTVGTHTVHFVKPAGRNRDGAVERAVRAGNLPWERPELPPVLGEWRQSFRPWLWVISKSEACSSWVLLFKVVKCMTAVLRPHLFQDGWQTPFTYASAACADASASGHKAVEEQFPGAVFMACYPHKFINLRKIGGIFSAIFEGHSSSASKKKARAWNCDWVKDTARRFYMCSSLEMYMNRARILDAELRRQGGGIDGLRRHIQTWHNYPGSGHCVGFRVRVRKIPEPEPHFHCRVRVLIIGFEPEFHRT